MEQIWNDRTAQAYLERHGDHALNRLWLEHVSLSPEDFLLDIGCGGGAALEEAFSRVNDIRAVGIDPVAVMVRTARKKLPKADIYEASAESIPLPGEVVSLALANCSASYWPDLQDGLAEIARVLKPGGRLLVIEEAFAALSDGVELRSPQDLPVHLRKAGFEVSDHGHHDKENESYWATLAHKP